MQQMSAMQQVSAMQQMSAERMNLYVRNRLNVVAQASLKLAMTVQFQLAENCDHRCKTRHLAKFYFLTSSQ